MSKPAYGYWPYLRLRDVVLLLRPGKNEAVARQTLALSWLLRAGRIADGTYITNRYKRDGVGSQLVHTLNVQAFAEGFSIPYAHAPLRIVSQSLRTFAQADIPKWEKHLNLGAGRPMVDELDLPEVKLDEYLRAPEMWRRPCILSHVSPRCYVGANPRSHEAVVARHRASLPSKPASGRGPVEVAVHVRRGDVTRERHPRRFAGNDRIRTAIGRIRHALARGGLEARITIYSDGETRDFVDLQGEGAAIRLDHNPLEDFVAMQRSDILVIGKSSFSYLAGLFHLRGIVIHQAWGYPLGAKWLGIDDIEGGLLRLLQRDDSHNAGGCVETTSRRTGTDDR